LTSGETKNKHLLWTLRQCVISSCNVCWHNKLTCTLHRTAIEPSGPPICGILSRLQHSRIFIRQSQSVRLLHILNVHHSWQQASMTITTPTTTSHFCSMLSELSWVFGTACRRRCGRPHHCSCSNVISLGTRHSI